MKEKKENSGCGCQFVALWVIALMAACFVYLMKYPEYFGAVVLCILVVIFVFCLIIHSLSDDGSLKDDITEEQEQPEFESTRPSEQSKQQDKQSIPTYSLIDVPHKESFANKEEEMVNRQFREYIQAVNRGIKFQANLEGLKQKRSFAITSAEKAQLDQEIDRLDKDLWGNKLNSMKKTYRSDMADVFYNDEKLKAKYHSFIDMLPDNDQVPSWLSDFFPSKQVKICDVGFVISEWAIFTPAYVMICDKPEQGLKLCTYSYEFSRAKVEENPIGSGYQMTFDIAGRAIGFESEEMAKTFKERLRSYADSLDWEIEDLGLKHQHPFPASISSLTTPSSIKREITKERKAAELEEEKQNLRSYLTVEDGVLTKWSGYLNDLEIPPGLATEIGKAFQCRRSTLKTIVLPEGIREIQAEAFLGCSVLRSVSLPATMRKIGKRAFSGCKSLRELVIPDGVVEIEDEAFANCTKLKRLVIPDTVEKIGEKVLEGSTSLESLYIGTRKIPANLCENFRKLSEVTASSQIMEIGDRAFAQCTHLKKLESAGNRSGFPHLEKIGDYAFFQCSAFEGFDLSDQVKEVGSSAFAFCSSLENINVSSGVNWYRRSCFTGTRWLRNQADHGYIIDDDYLEYYGGNQETAEIPSGIRIVGKYAFYQNSRVKEIKVPDTAEEIEDYAFAECKNLRYVDIPDSVVSIADSALTAGSGVTIRCTRGSAASKFRIRNKFSCEYAAKYKEAPQRKTPVVAPIVAERKPPTRNSEISGLTEEEFSLIMDMRRKKVKEKEEAKRAEQERKERKAVSAAAEKTYTLSAWPEDKVKLTAAGKSRLITNNIFPVAFIQTEAVSDQCKEGKYEVFAVDSSGQMISNISEIDADGSISGMEHRATLILSAHGEFDKSADYFVVIREKGKDTEILEKIPYKINIEFASEFDF